MLCSKPGGFWAYKDALRSCILRQADKAGEQLGELDVLVQYDIVWKDGLNHDIGSNESDTGRK